MGIDEPGQQNLRRQIEVFCGLNSLRFNPGRNAGKPAIADHNAMIGQDFALWHHGYDPLGVDNKISDR